MMDVGWGMEVKESPSPQKDLTVERAFRNFLATFRRERMRHASSAPSFYETVRREIRLRNYSQKTAKCYKADICT